MSSNGLKAALALVATGAACLIVAAYFTYGLIPALAVAGVTLLVAGTLLGVMWG